MTETKQPDDSLQSWEEIQGHDWTSLLLGNGFSQNIWQRFGYASLYKTAQSDEVARRLVPEDLSLFDRLKTHNFEVILSALSTGIMVTEALGKDADFLKQRYESIRQALVAAVHHVHISWNNFPEAHRERIADHLVQFEFVYSTNYDLLTYWCVMHGVRSFKDYFWSQAFDITNTQIWGKYTKVLYLHGGLHLYRRPNGQTLKRTATAGQNLLDLFGTPYDDAIPLFISEGTAEEKKASIYRSEYLAFTFSQFSQDIEPLVVFGHSLSEFDEHLIDVMRKQNGRRIVVAIKPGHGSIRERKKQLHARLPHAQLDFFDAETYPLGAEGLTVEDINK